MSQRELKSLLSPLLPYVHGQKQATALFTVGLLLGLSHADFDAPHLHVEPAPIEPTATVMVAATNTASGTMMYHWSPYNPYGR
jgi:hypothetical protein